MCTCRDKDMQKCAVISRDLNVHAHKWIQHVFFRARVLPATHLFLLRETWALFNLSLSISPVLSTQRNSERQKNMSCKREPIVPWREQMEPPTNHWALHSPGFLKKNHRHKQQHWLFSSIKRLCFYIHSGVLKKMWRCPCAILQAEIRLCVTNAHWARHGNPQTELVHTPPRYRLLSDSPSSRSQSVGLTIPSWTCASGWFRQKEFEDLKTMTRFLQVVFACKKAAGMMQGCCWQFSKILVARVFWLVFGWFIVVAYWPCQ